MQLIKLGLIFLSIYLLVCACLCVCTQLLIPLWMHVKVVVQLLGVSSILLPAYLPSNYSS